MPRSPPPPMLTIAFDTFVLANGLTGDPSRRPVEPARRGRPMVPRRIEGRIAGPHRLRAPVRAPDVHGLAQRALPGVRRDHGELGRPQQRHHQQRPHELLRDRPAQPARDVPVAGGRSAGDAARRDHRRGAGAAAQGRAERAPPVVREPPLRRAPSWRSRRRCTRPSTPTTGRRSARTRISRRRPSPTCARSSSASTGRRTPAW